MPDAYQHAKRMLARAVRRYTHAKFALDDDNPRLDRYNRQRGNLLRKLYRLQGLPTTKRRPRSWPSEKTPSRAS